MIVLLFISCEEATKSKVKQASLEVQIPEDGYVVLHSLDGKEIVEVKSAIGDEIVVFENIESSRVTFTVVFKGSQGYLGPEGEREEAIARLFSFFEVPIESFQIKGALSDIQNYGNINLKVEYPETEGENDYTSKYISQGGHLQSIENSFEVNIHNHNPENCFKLLGYVWDKQNKFGFFNWLDSDDMVINESNEYNFDISKPIKSKKISFNREVGNIELNILRESFDYNESYWQTKYPILINSNPTQLNEYQLYFVDFLDGDKYSFSISRDFDDRSSYYMQYICDEIPDYIKIPSKSFKAKIDKENSIITDIYCDDADYILTHLSYYDRILEYSVPGFEYHSYTLLTRWTIYAPTNYEKIENPTIPENIITKFDMNNFNFLDINCSLADYSLVNGYDDFFRSGYISSNTQNSCFGNLFSYGISK